MLVLKTGTTTSTTINTGLSSVKMFVLYRTTLTSSGFIHGSWHETLGVRYMYCSTYTSSTSNAIIMSGTTKPTINGGRITWSLSGTQALSSGVTYTWIAYGEE